MSSGSPTQPSKNPEIILFDNDAISQLFIANSYQPLRTLKRNYGIQAAIVEAVDKELRQNRKFFASIETVYDKCLRTEVLLQLDDRSYPRFSNSPHAISSAIANLGAKYHTKIEEGEAYTHAASVVLRVPVVSHDRSALRVMDRAGWEYVQPVLEVFDILALAHQNGSMTATECDEVRKAISARKNEYVHPAFKNSSFSNGLPHFSPRLVCRVSPAVGAAIPEGTPVHLIMPIASGSTS